MIGVHPELGTVVLLGSQGEERVSAEQLEQTESVLSNARLSLIDRSNINGQGSLVVRFANGDSGDLQAVVTNALADGNISEATVETERGRLDDVFRDLTAEA